MPRKEKPASGHSEANETGIEPETVSDIYPDIQFNPEIDSKPENIPENIPENVSENVSENVPENIPENTPVSIADKPHRAFEADPGKVTSIVCGNRVLYAGRGVVRVEIFMRGDDA